MQNLNDNKSTSSNFVRSNHESSNANSLVINTNDATKRKEWWNLKIEQMGMDQTLIVEDEETGNDNISLDKIYKHHHTTKTKHWTNKKTRSSSEVFYDNT